VGVHAQKNVKILFEWFILRLMVFIAGMRGAGRGTTRSEKAKILFERLYWD
jgi:hypothetical protein